jgi:peptide/nickel transport system permease protein
MRALKTFIASSNSQIRLGLLLTLLILLIALLGPWFAPYPAQEMVAARYSGPQSAAWLGADYLGQDVLSRILHGGISIVWMSVVSSLLGLGIGIAFGLVAGFFKHRTDQVIIWIADIFLAFPHLILVLLVVSMLGRDKWLIAITVAIAFVPGVIRLTRSLTLSVSKHEYIEVAEMMGYPHHQILLREILPNILTPLLIHLGTMLSWSVALLSGLSFLGYGVAPPEADWGLMVNENKGGLQIQPFSILVPIVLIAVFALGANLLAEGLGRRFSRISESGQPAADANEPAKTEGKAYA